MKRKMLRTVSLLIALCTVITVFMSASAEETATKTYEIDKKRETTQKNVDKLMSTGGYKITDTPSDSLVIPQNAPETLLKELEDMLNDAPYSCALYYQDLETGFTIAYNEERFFGGASLIKMPYMMSLLNKIDKGEATLADEIEYKKAYKKGGTVQIPYDYDFGAKLSIELLLEYLVYYSDNTAFSMLLNNACSLSTFRSFGRKAYGTEFYKSGINSLTAEGTAAAFIDLYNKSKNGERNYVWLLEMLKQANENKFIRNGLPKDENGVVLYQVAHKYGMDINSSNDAAIVFCGERPYVLVILTDYIGYNTQSFMNKVSAKVYSIHEYIIAEK